MYNQIWNSLLNMTATNDVLPKAHDQIVQITRLTNSPPLQLEDSLQVKMLRLYQVYDHSILNRMFMEGLQTLI